jgi:signal transduction histidine kinase
MSRWSPERPRPADVVLTVTVGVFAGLGAWGTSSWQLPPVRPIDTAGYALAVLASAALIARRSWPLQVLAVSTTAAAGYLALSYPFGPPFLAMGLAMYFVAAQLPWRRSVAVCLLACTAVITAILIAARGRLLPSVPVMLAGGIGWLVLPCAVGIVLRIGRDDVAQSREEEARRRAYEERLRIARKIHEVAGERLAAINMQSAVALYVAAKRPSQTHETLNAIKQDSKEALEQLRATLGMLSQESEHSAPRRPMPGLREVSALISTMNDSGLQVEVVVKGTGGGLTAAVDLAAYRIVQQALANVLRDASSTTATVLIDYAGEGVCLEITDDRRGPAGESDSATLAGMRQRANAVGGELTVEPRPEGGYQVRTLLPLRART